MRDGGGIAEQALLTFPYDRARILVDRPDNYQFSFRKHRPRFKVGQFARRGTNCVRVTKLRRRDWSEGHSYESRNVHTGEVAWCAGFTFDEQFRSLVTRSRRAPSRKISMVSAHVGEKMAAASVLKELGVAFDRRNGFWIRNEASLHYLLHDAKEAAKRMRIKLHPDGAKDEADRAHREEQSKRIGRMMLFLERAFHRRGVR